MLLLAIRGATGYDNGLALTPPLGWNSWNQFGCNVSADLIERQASSLVSSGLAAVGYEYVVIDDCWQAPARDGDGRLAADAARFPEGIAALAAKVHAMGLKLGIYSDVGSKTCQGFPGSYGSYDVDAATFADWQVDYVKFDTCHLTWDETVDPAPFYRKMSSELNATGRPMVYSICNWGRSDPWTWAPPFANLWRTTLDIYPQWHRVVAILDASADVAPYAGPGAWNDPDMIEVGVTSTLWNWKHLPATNLTRRESAAHFSLWAVLAAPLILGLDLEHAEPWALAIVGNAAVVAVNQDALGAPGARVRANSSGVVGDACLAARCTRTEVWAKRLQGGRAAVAFFNRAGAYDEDAAAYGNETLTIAFADLGLPNAAYDATDAWTGAALDAPSPAALSSAPVPPHGVQLVLLAPRPSGHA